MQKGKIFMLSQELENVVNAEQNLVSLSNELNETYDTEKLVEFANLYIECCDGKNALRNMSHMSIYEAECSYEDLRLYFFMDGRYRTLLGELFAIDEKGNGLYSAAGINDGYHQWYDYHLEERIKEKRDLLDVCLRFYKALKKERNSTNHADEVDFNHMDYRCIRKAILVFVELCKRLVA